MADAERTTGTSNVNYTLVNILYHTIQGTELSVLYIGDAEQAGDQELIRVLRQIEEENLRRAEQLKELIRARLPGLPIPPERPRPRPRPER
jgi:hypothetical protein